MAIPGTNNTGTPDAIDSTDYVMTIIRAIRRFPGERKREIEAVKYPKDKEAAEKEKIYRSGYLAALADLEKYMATVSRGI